MQMDVLVPLGLERMVLLILVLKNNLWYIVLPVRYYRNWNPTNSVLHQQPLYSSLGLAVTNSRSISVTHTIKIKIPILQLLDLGIWASYFISQLFVLFSFKACIRIKVISNTYLARKHYAKQNYLIFRKWSDGY